MTRARTAARQRRAKGRGTDRVLKRPARALLPLVLEPPERVRGGHLVAGLLCLHELRLERRERVGRQAEQRKVERACGVGRDALLDDVPCLGEPSLALGRPVRDGPVRARGRLEPVELVQLAGNRQVRDKVVGVLLLGRLGGRVERERVGPRERVVHLADLARAVGGGGQSNGRRAVEKGTDGPCQSC